MPSDEGDGHAGQSPGDAVDTQRSAAGSVRMPTCPLKSRRTTDLGPQTPSAFRMSQPDNSHYVRRVVLPSGRAIEVVYFDNQPRTSEPARRAPRPPRTSGPPPLPRVRRAGSVYPVEWEEARRPTGRSHSAARTASGTTSASATRTPSTASTRSSTAAPRRSSATSSASRGPTWRTRSSASSRRSSPTPSGRGLLPPRSGVAVDDPVGHQLERRALGVGQRRQVRLRRRHHRQRLARARPPARPWRRSRRTPPRPAPACAPRAGRAARAPGRARGRG